MEYIFSAIAGILSGAMSAMGLGAGTILLLYLTMFTDTPQLTAQGINLIFFIPCALTALFFHFKKGFIKLRAALFCASGGVLGVFLGIYLSEKLKPDLLRKLFGGFLLIICIREVIIGIKEVREKKKDVSEIKKS